MSVDRFQNYGAALLMSHPNVIMRYYGHDQNSNNAEQFDASSFKKTVIKHGSVWSKCPITADLGSVQHRHVAHMVRRPGGLFC